MAKRHGDLPTFDNPPLIETALGVQFEQLTSLDVPRMGLLYGLIRDTLPVVQQQLPLNPVIERLGERLQQTPLSFQFSQQPPSPRCWFLDNDGERLLQVQQDRLIWNWRKTKGERAYPRYENDVRPRFIEYFDKFLKFLDDERIGDFQPNQCEVIYVNHIRSGQGWAKHAEIDKVFVGWRSSYSRSLPLELESTHILCRHIIYDENHEFIGRLHINIEPAFNKLDDQPMFVMTLTARGKPMGPGRDGVLKFLDLGRQHIVQAFEAATTPTMHDIWGKHE